MSGNAYRTVDNREDLIGSWSSIGLFLRALAAASQNALGGADLIARREHLIIHTKIADGREHLRCAAVAST
jgi:hypothetical protein